MLKFKVTFNRNVKLGKDLYQKGETSTVGEDICDELVEKGVINEGYEPIKPKTVDEMTIPELREFATENSFDLGEAKKRDDILEAIQTAEDGKDLLD